ncbi:MAG: hypothetical protein ACNI28_09735 [Arcobacter sp.]|uniref:hypothetical protein n=1 Tax=Arcobacter sp. TaxID=1872629 RepID=UPI003AFFA887
MDISNIKHYGLVILFGFVFGGCSAESYHTGMISDIEKSVDKNFYEDIKNPYTKSLVTEVNKKQTYINILEEKSLKDVLKEIEVFDNNIYYLKSTDITIPKSRIQIASIDDLNAYLGAVLDKELVVQKSGPISLVELVNKSEAKRKKLDYVKFDLNGEVSIEELIKLITSTTGYGVFIGNNIESKQTFLNSVISINSSLLKDALNSLEHLKNVYVDIDYDKEMIHVARYKDVVIELNIPLLNVKTSNETTTSESSGANKIENSSDIVLYEELDKMIKNIISDDKNSTYHIDKSTGLIFLKSTKEVEQAVRTVAKSYEASFAKEATIEFEKIEIILNKNRTFGITSLSKIATDSTDTTLVKGSSASIGLGGVVGYANQQADNLVQSLATVNNGIGKMLSYSQNMMVLKNNIPVVQSISQNTDYIEKIETTVTDTTVTSDATVGTIKDGTSISAFAKIGRDKIFLNITPNVKKLIQISEATVGNSVIQLPEYNDQSYNISRELRLGETAIVGSMIVHDDAKNYEGILPLEGFAIGGTDSKSYVRREILYIVTLRSIKGF